MPSGLSCAIAPTFARGESGLLDCSPSRTALSVAHNTQYGNPTEEKDELSECDRR